MVRPETQRTRPTKTVAKPFVEGIEIQKIQRIDYCISEAVQKVLAASFLPFDYSPAPSFRATARNLPITHFALSIILQPLQFRPQQSQNTPQISNSCLRFFDFAFYSRQNKIFV